ncbi:MAG: glycosyltransferase family 2 protein [Coriobacteriia bacterium]|nr:glycosyltransferase family 2 protein [Coriobacteriia bacterium]
MQDHLISIVTPLHNGENYIAQTIESARAQSYRNFEMLIINDHSSDASARIVQDIAEKDERITLIDAQAYGAAQARNQALRLAQGDFIAFLDADDLWLEDKLEKQVAFMEEKNIDFSYHPYDLIDKDSNDLHIRREVPHKVTYKSLLFGLRFGCLSVMYRRSAAPNIQAADLKKRNDYALWLKALKEIDAGYALNESLAKYRKLDDSLSAGKKYKLLPYHFELFRKNEGFGLVKSAFYTISNVVVYLDIKKNWEHPL